jgi:hypothetical protein
VTLCFVCAGPVIQAVVEGLLTISVLVLSGGAEVHWSRGIAPQFVREMLVSSAVASGLTGLLAGSCEMAFGPLSAGGRFAVSLVVPAAVLALLIATVPAFTDVVLSGNLRAVVIFLGPTAIAGLSFVVSMTACFRLTGMLTAGRPPATGRSVQP